MHTDKGKFQKALFAIDNSEQADIVTIRFEGIPLKVPAGISVAAALLLNNAGHFRTTPVNSAERAPYCMMGVCFECLVDIDGHPSRQSCLTVVQNGMNIKRQSGSADIESPRKEINHGD